MEVRFCCVYGVIYQEPVKPFHTMTVDRYRQQIAQLGKSLKEKRPGYAKSHEK